MSNTVVFPKPLDLKKLPDFSAAYDAIVRLKPVCAQCEDPLQESETGVRSMVNDDGQIQKVCRSCSVTGIGNALVGAQSVAVLSATA